MRLGVRLSFCQLQRLQADHVFPAVSTTPDVGSTWSRVRSARHTGGRSRDSDDRRGETGCGCTGGGLKPLRILPWMATMGCNSMRERTP